MTIGKLKLMDRDILYIEMYKLFKRRRAWIGPVLVFLLIIISFPLTLDINSDNPPQIYLSFIWISTLLVTMLGTELIFSDDFEDGTLAVSYTHLTLPTMS